VESFLWVIKQRLGRRMTAKELLTHVQSARLSDETLDRIDAQVRARPEKARPVKSRIDVDGPGSRRQTKRRPRITG
jgi:hypothetical protein